MPLESNPSTIADLDTSWPVGGDVTTDGDNHLRNIKLVLQQTFPNGSGGAGFNEPVLSTVTELNYLQGCNSNVQSQINALNGGASAGKLFLAAPNGAKLLWGNATAPSGWKYVENYTSLSVCASPQDLAGTNVGTDSPVEWKHSHSVQPFTLTSGQIPPHGHALAYNNVADNEGTFVHVGGAYNNRIMSQSGAFPAGETKLNSTSAQAVSQAITFESTYTPRVYHMAVIERDSSLDA